jgi:hypothetical protein
MAFWFLWVGRLGFVCRLVVVVVSSSGYDCDCDCGGSRLVVIDG